MNHGERIHKIISFILQCTRNIKPPKVLIPWYLLFFWNWPHQDLFSSFKVKDDSDLKRRECKNLLLIYIHIEHCCFFSLNWLKIDLLTAFWFICSFFIDLFIFHSFVYFSLILFKFHWFGLIWLILIDFESVFKKVIKCFCTTNPSERIHKIISYILQCTRNVKPPKILIPSAIICWRFCIKTLIKSNKNTHLYLHILFVFVMKLHTFSITIVFFILQKQMQIERVYL